MADSSQVRVGSKAPDFTLPDANGNPVRLQDLLEKAPVVVYFYPKDETTGCTLQACEFRDRHALFSAAGATVVGISEDDAQSHRSFRDHHQLPFLLLSDAGGSVRRAYGVKKTLGLISGRVTFVIDRHGVVQHVFSSQLQPRRHVDEALRAVERLRTQ
ncbi:MAG TPA: peroxiredoxin [Polyangiaceae bacterium]